MAFVRLSEKL